MIMIIDTILNVNSKTGFIVGKKENMLSLCHLTPEVINTIENQGDKTEVKWNEVKVAQSCLTLCDPMDYTVRAIRQARILEWVAFPFSTGSSQPRDRTQVSRISGKFFTNWATKEAQEYWSVVYNTSNIQNLLINCWSYQ